MSIINQYCIIQLGKQKLCYHGNCFLFDYTLGSITF